MGGGIAATIAERGPRTPNIELGLTAPEAALAVQQGRLALDSLDPVTRELVALELGITPQSEGPAATPAATIAVDYSKVAGKQVREVVSKAIPEDPSTPMGSADDTGAALRALQKLVNAPAPAKARGGRVVNFNSPDDATARKLARQTGRRWDRPADLLEARAIHAMTVGDRSTPSSDKVITAPLVLQTVQQADLVAERAMRFTDERGVEGRVPVVVFAKLYNDPNSPTGVRWHFVEVRKNGMLFETQYSTTNREPMGGRAVDARVVGVGEQPAKEKVRTEAGGFTQGIGPAQMPGDLQGKDALPTNRADRGLDNTTGENVQSENSAGIDLETLRLETLLNEIEALEEKWDRLTRARQYDAAGRVFEQTQELYRIADATPGQIPNATPALNEAQDVVSNSRSNKSRFFMKTTNSIEILKAEAQKARDSYLASSHQVTYEEAKAQTKLFLAAGRNSKNSLATRTKTGSGS